MVLWPGPGGQGCRRGFSESRALALLGPSGSGKTSLVRAGVLPALAGGALPGSRRWGSVIARPGSDPFAELERAGLAGARGGLVEAVNRWLADHSEDDRLLLVLDQLGDTGSVWPVAFSPDGATLASGSGDPTVRLWAAPMTWVDQACELAGRNLSQAEWEEHVGADRPYVRQCEQFAAGPGAPVDAPVARYPAALSGPRT